jgi:pimeloyl-ACP methyl ester carboxylesterase
MSSRVGEGCVDVTSSPTRIVPANGVDICVQTFGEPAQPVVLLIMGSSASMDWWEDELCERLAGRGRFVIRYDHRDTGQSVSYPPGEPGYGVQELVDDAADLLDHFGVEVAHVVGMSLGGGIAQLLALDHPDRVASLTLIATAPAAPGPDDPDLPAMSEEAQARFMIEPPDWTDRDSVVEHLVHLARASAAPSAPFDEAPFRALAARVFDRTRNMESSYTNHNRLAGGERSRERLGELTMPTLVLHGDEDPVVPFGNGEALAREIPAARLITLPATGHEIPRRVWDTVVPEILEHTGD